MKYTTYSKYLPELADTINLQGLLDQLADFLLQSGFAGGPYSHPFWGEFGEDEPDRSMDALRQAILRALMDSGQLTPEMLKLLRGESTGDAQRDAELERQLGELLDKIVQKLIEEGYLNVTQAPQLPGGQQPVTGPGGMAREAAQQVQFSLTEKGIDFLGYKTLKHLLGSPGSGWRCRRSCRFPPTRSRTSAGKHYPPPAPPSAGNGCRGWRGASAGGKTAPHRPSWMKNTARLNPLPAVGRAGCSMGEAGR